MIGTLGISHSSTCIRMRASANKPLKHISKSVNRLALLLALCWRMRRVGHIFGGHAVWDPVVKVVSAAEFWSERLQVLSLTIREFSHRPPM